MIHNFLKKGTQVMVDIETLHNKPGAVIFEIGAVCFDTESVKGTPFHAIISPISCESYGLRCGAETVVWWMKQGAEKQATLMEAMTKGLELPVALQQFSNWLPKGARLWGNSASFDLGLLSAAYTRARMEQPWLPWNEECFRTVKNMAPFAGQKVDYGTGHHSGVIDAIAQANHLIKLNKPT
jgi:hypothetical protein